MKKRLRKYLALLCIVACVFSLTACGEEKSDKVTYTEESAENYVAKMEEHGYECEDADAYIKSEVDGIVSSIEQNLIYQDRDELLGLYEGDEESTAIAESYLEATEDLGKFKEEDAFNLSFEMSEDSIVVKGTFAFEKRDLNFTHTVDLTKGTSSFVFERELSIGEILQKAGMNTLLGMGSVFLVLILISFVISCFGFLSKGGSKSETKAEAKQVVPETQNIVPEAPATAAPAAGIPDEVEMAIVIATAIAAAEEETGSDGYRVRSIKRANNSKWRRA